MGEGKQAWGWYPAGNIWVPLQVAATGKLVIDPTAVFEEPPTLGELEKGATSNWCNLHAADADAHHDAFTPADHQADPHTMTLDGVDLSAHAVDVDAHHGAFTPADHTAIGDGAPHHARYTDAEALLVAAPLAHHARHEAGGADALANPIAIAAVPDLASGKIWQGNAGNRPVEVDLPAGGTKWFYQDWDYGTGGSVVAVGQHNCYYLNSQYDSVSFEFRTPPDWASIAAVKMLIISEGTGTFDYTARTSWALIGANYNANTDVLTADGVAVTDGIIKSIDLTEAFTGLAANMSVGLKVTLDALATATGIFAIQLDITYN